MALSSPEPLWDGAGAEEDESDASLEMELNPDGRKDSADEDSEREFEINFPETPETCLQINLVYQEIIEEKIEEVISLLSQNKQEQEKLTRELTGPKEAKSSDGKAMPGNVFLGHFMKPYFKDKTSGIGPPANSDAREKAVQGIKPFEDLITTKWKSREKLLLRESVISDHLQRLLQPKLLKLEYLTNKWERSQDEMEKQILTKQIQEVKREMNNIEQLSEEVLLGNRFDKHDWDKIANVNFEGTRSSKELQKYWQNSEHPSINKKEWSEEEIEKLKEIAARHKCVNWETIAQELGTQRTAFQCLQKFQVNNKEFKRREWTPKEDQMLSQLVQEMRVGNHIPYRKIAYYMEGRDSSQLVYRWSKRVDPNVRHGSWTAEEDALLLKAVAKYGERDWYKIRMEVPGRNDIQCRERYLHALHCDIKKGKWSEEEEKKLIELTEKYGVGHWAKIASELPHRSGSQCLSKWKILLGYWQNRRRKQRSNLCQKLSEESSSEDSDLELEEDSTEEEEEEEEYKKPKLKPWRVPSIDLWIPRRQNFSGLPGELASVTLLSKGFDVNRKRKRAHGALLVAENDHTSEGLDSRTSPSVHTQAEKERAVEENRISRGEKDSWRVSLAFVKCVLRRNGYELQRKYRELRRKKLFASLSRSGVGRDLVPPSRGIARGQRDGMWRMTLTRRLMMAVAPWSGHMVQAWAHRVKNEAACKSRVEFIFNHLQTASLNSTPLFTLFIQLFHIDVDGCMKTIQKKRSPQLELLKAVAGNAGGTRQASPSQDSTAQLNLCMRTSKKLIPLKAKEGPLPTHAQQAFCPPCTASKPKTVSELLREKRLQKWKAERALPRKVVLAPQLLLPSPVIIQPLAQMGCRGFPTAVNGLSLPSLSPVGVSAPPGSLEALKGSRGEEVSASSKEDGRLQEDSQGVPVAAHSASLLPEQSHLPLQILAAKLPTPVASLSPASMGTGTKKPPYLVPAACAQGPVNSQQNSIKLAPPLVALPPGSSEATKQSLPLTILLTDRGLIPMTVVSLPNAGTSSATSSLGMSPGLSRAAEASPVSAGPVAVGQPLPGAVWEDRRSDLTLPPVLLAPAASAELQHTSPTTCPLMPPLPSASVWSVQNNAHLTRDSQNSAVRNSHHPAVPGGARGPPEKTFLPLRLQQQENATQDYRLISLEDVAAVKEWARGGSGPRFPSLETSLPYLPPFLCSLKTLSMLLLNKAALERTAACLVTPEGQQETSQQLDLNALKEVVHQSLRENPAYQLLKARFLAAFALPAALAVLAPPRTLTTLSGERQQESSCSGDSSMSAAAAEEEDHRVAEQLEEPGTDQIGMPEVRRSPRLRRRRRHL